MSRIHDNPFAISRIEPGRELVVVTPNDGADLTDTPTRGIYVGVSGDLAVVGEENAASVVLVGIAAGIIHPIAVKRVLATGTTATGIVAVY